MVVVQVVAVESSSEDDLMYTVFANGGSAEIGRQQRTAASSVPRGPVRITAYVVVVVVAVDNYSSQSLHAIILQYRSVPDKQPR